MDYFDRDGRPVDPKTASLLLSDWNYCRIALTRITSATDPSVDVIVSTAWLGFDVSWDGDGRNVFQTAVFGATARQTRHSSIETEARGLHLEAVSILAALTPAEQVTEIRDWPSDRKEAHRG
jgi:hypothetical protein